MSNQSAAMNRRQNARNQSSGRYTVMTKQEGVGLGSGVDSELTAAQFLASISGTDQDPRALPRDPLRDGVEARVSISENSASSVASLYDWTLDEMSEVDFSLGAVDVAQPLPDNATFELREKVRSNRLDAPRLVAVLDDGSEQEILNVADLADQMSEPYMDAEDGSWSKVDTLRHASDDWLNAIAASESRGQQQVGRAHDLVEDMGWVLELHSASRGEWLVRNTEDRSSLLRVGRGGSLVETSNWREAQPEHIAAAVGEAHLVDDARDMLSAALKLAVENPTPKMKHSLARAPLVDRRSGLWGEPRERVTFAQDVLAIHAGEKQAPARGPLAKAAKQLAETKGRIAIAQQKHARAVQEHEEHVAAYESAGKLPELLAGVIEEKLDDLKSTAGWRGGELFKERQNLDRILGPHQYVLEREVDVKAQRAELDAQLAAMDAEFEASQGK